MSRRRQRAAYEPAAGRGSHRAHRNGCDLGDQGGQGGVGRPVRAQPEAGDGAARSEQHADAGDREHDAAPAPDRPGAPWSVLTHLEDVAVIRTRSEHVRILDGGAVLRREVEGQRDVAEDRPGDVPQDEVVGDSVEPLAQLDQLDEPAADRALITGSAAAAACAWTWKSAWCGSASNSSR